MDAIKPVYFLGLPVFDWRGFLWGDAFQTRHISNSVMTGLFLLLQRLNRRMQIYFYFNYQQKQLNPSMMSFERKPEKFVLSGFHWTGSIFDYFVNHGTRNLVVIKESFAFNCTIMKTTYPIWRLRMWYSRAYNVRARPLELWVMTTAASNYLGFVFPPSWKF